MSSNSRCLLIFLSLRVYHYLLYIYQIFSVNPECLLLRCKETSTCFTEAARLNMQPTVYIIYHDAFSCAAAEITIESGRNRTRDITTRLLLSRNKFSFIKLLVTIKLEHQIFKALPVISQESKMHFIRSL